MNLIQQLPENLLSQLSILILALAFDLIVGEPPEQIHPTALIGKAIDWLRKRANSTESHTRFIGVFLACAMVTAAAGATFIILENTKLHLSQPVYIVLGAFLLKTSFAVRSMELHIRPIEEALEDGDLCHARKALGKIVRRNTEQLDENLCASASIESIAEGSVDGIVSPLFYFFLFGVPAAMAFRAISTLDSMIGYREEAYAKIGWFSARLDTLANYLPSRLTAAIMIIATALLGRDWRTSLSTLRMEHNRTESLNAGWPMAAMAGSIRVRLQKLGCYRLGEQFRTPTHSDIEPALHIMKLTTFLFLIAATIPYSLVTFLLTG